jgi:hypothetical protein
LAPVIFHAGTDIPIYLAIVANAEENRACMFAQG